MYSTPSQVPPFATIAASLAIPLAEALVEQDGISTLTAPFSSFYNQGPDLSGSIAEPIVQSSAFSGQALSLGFLADTFKDMNPLELSTISPKLMYDFLPIHLGHIVDPIFMIDSPRARCFGSP
jgi:hypothetical protein